MQTDTGCHIGRMLMLAAMLVAPHGVRADEPMSAIEWLSPSVDHQSGAQPRIRRTDPPVTHGITVEPVTEMSLDNPPTNAVGLVGTTRNGIPIDFWGKTPEADLAIALRKERIGTLPSIQAFLMQILLAELEPPTPSALPGQNTLFLARIDRLLDMGALDQAMALLEQAPAGDSEIFRRRFDVALLLGQEDAACQIMASTPAVSPSFSARIFCLARRGDWSAAALSLDTGVALGQIDPEMARLLDQFLDPALAEESPELPPPTRPSPLVFRMMEAIGTPMATSTLPVAFAHADLQSNHGWKAQLEAAERLTRSGVLDPNQLLGLYTRQRASASGGVWERVTIISSLDRALNDNNTERVAQLLPAAWDAMQGQELEPALAAMFSDRLAKTDLPPDAAAIAFRLSLLTPEFAARAATHKPADADEAFLIAVAAGNTADVEAQDRMGLIVESVFGASPRSVPTRYRDMLPDQPGTAVLTAIDDITEGARGDLRRVRDGLTLLRLSGYETIARRSALELLVLERNG